MRQRTVFLVSIACLGMFLGTLAAQDYSRKRGSGGAAQQAAPKKQEASKEKDTKPAKAEDLKESLSKTIHEITLRGRKLEYEATAGNLILKDDDGNPRASMFFVAYHRLNATQEVPLTFVFNGGPGSSAVWLHLGAFGPRRVAIGEGGEPLPPPYRLVDNEDTLLDLTDLVFIDPVSTGYSRPAPGQAAKQFHGVQEDIQSVGDFIRQYTSRFGRWGSPKFVAGESYGTTRAAGLSGYLQERAGLNLNGIILVSTVLNFGTLRFDDGNDLPYPLFLPTYTATAWYHKKLPADLQMDRERTLKAVQEFALGAYNSALMKGNKLSPEERQDIVRKLSRFTGLSTEYIERSNLRIPIYHFTQELLRDKSLVVGRYDSRYKGPDLDPLGNRAGYDPSYTAVQGAFTATLNEYLKKDLHYSNDLPYEILTGRVQPWDYGNSRNRYLNMATTLEQALVKNPYLRVFQANGYYDLATPYFATEYTFNHMEPAAALAGRVSMRYYEAGHMMYVNRSSHDKLKRDLAEFYKASLHEQPTTQGLGR